MIANQFSGVSHEQKYGFDLEFFAEIVKADSAWNTRGRHIIVSLGKKDKDAEYWPRILKQAGKNARIQVDWAKWVDEDEASDHDDGDQYDPNAMQGFGGMPGMEGMGGMPGMGGMGGMDFAKMM